MHVHMKFTWRYKIKYRFWSIILNTFLNSIWKQYFVFRLFKPKCINRCVDIHLHMVDFFNYIKSSKSLTQFLFFPQREWTFDSVTWWEHCQLYRVELKIWCGCVVMNIFILDDRHNRWSQRYTSDLPLHIMYWVTTL